MPLYASLVVQEELIATLRRAGADSPRNARTIAELRVATDDVWDGLVRRGTIREGAPGTFYLFAVNGPTRRERVLKMAVFYTLILLIPIVLMLMTRRPG